MTTTTRPHPDEAALLAKLEWEQLPADFRETTGRLSSTWLDAWAGYNPEGPNRERRSQ